ncbi:hypothetical protein [Calidithermus chliarophilus]|uniref:hypothetical protein n=1 Tax=Calidithermus chliarophilus TaxID=52023 RepID=UPI000413732D|nr:hypothetical protein [Calidithermus chliarophilus]
MDPLTGALVKGGIELVGGIVQGVTGYQIAQTQAGVAREQIAAQERALREAQEVERARIRAQLEAAGITAGRDKERYFYGSQNLRAFAFYGSQGFRAVALVVLGVAGAAALAYALKESR